LLEHVGKFPDAGLNHHTAAATNPVGGADRSETMVALSRVSAPQVQRTSYRHLLMQLGWLAGAALFVAALYLSYGLDLSPGFF
jgi:hypothetical protein